VEDIAEEAGVGGSCTCSS